MPFNPKTDANITVSKQHKEMLKRIAVEQKRTLRATAEMLIEQGGNPLYVLNGITNEVTKL